MREGAAIECLYRYDPLQPVRKNLQGNNELRPPQAAVYVYVLDVSASAVESGYLHAFSEQFLINLDQMPGDNRTLMAFLAVDNGVHFFEFSNQDIPPKQIIATDVDDIFIPKNTGLLLNVAQWKEEIRSFVQSLPTVFESNQSSSNALGAALTVAHQLIADVGGRITVITTTLPDIGPGALKSREDPNQRAANEVENLGLATDFYKRLSLECTGHQVAIDLFMLNSKYADLATLSEMAKYGGGNVHHFPNYHIMREPTQVKRFEKTFCRYLTRKIGFEAVLRIRCTKGLALHTFHGNFFVRSTDLLALPNINPDTAMGVQVQMEENLTGLQSVCFQAALLYTSSKGDRRIRVHTMCLPVTSDLATVHNKIDIKCTMSMLAKMAVERSITAGGSLNDAREAMVNAAVDAIGSFNRSIPGSRGAASLLAPTGGLRLFPLYVLGLLKHPAFVLGRSVKLDDRLAAMCMFKTAPIKVVML
uniref:Uncharacterized protein n=1 Tax=Plectus sambesii TaxID=2011161 RepID=A0A914XLL7_9BILA